MDPTQILTDNGLQNAAELVLAAEVAGLPLHIAAAVIEKESGGRNVYGGDVGGVFATDPRTPVTAENYALFEQSVLAGATSNGVGPAQITYRGFIQDAKDRGIPLWIPYDNMLYGFRLIAGYLTARNGDLAEVGTLYNKGNLNDGVNEYGIDLYLRAEEWLDRIAGAGMARRQPTQAEMEQIAKVLLSWGLVLYCDPSDWRSGACRPGNHSHSSDSRHFLGRAVDFGWGAAPISDLENLIVLIAIRMLERRFPNLAIRKLFNVGPGNHEDHGHADDMGLGTGGWASTVRDPKRAMARDGVDLFVPAGMFGGAHVPPINHGLTMAHVAKFQTAAAKLGLYSGRSDGYHGKMCTEAAKAVQRKAGLTVDGKAGPATLAAALKLLEPVVDPYAGFTEAYIREVQVMLKHLGFYTMAIDGEPGNGFQTAVKAFQTKFGLKPVDGLPGTNTRAAIEKAYEAAREIELTPKPAPAPEVVSVPVSNVSGPDRYSTAAAISKRRFPTTAAVVYLAATGTDEVGLATFNDGPTLLMRPGSTTVPLATANELRRLNPKRVVRVGGAAGVTDAALKRAAQIAAE